MSGTVLLADDHDVNRQVLRRRLERRGYKVVEAADGEQTVARFGEHKPTIVLLDLSMPKMDGKEAYAKMRAMPHGPSTPIVALTAHALPEVERSCLALGFDSFLTKPIEFEDLLRTLNAFAAAPATTRAR